MEKYNVSVIGLGHIGFKVGFDKKRIKPSSHIETILNSKRLRLSSVCDIDEKARDFFKKKAKNGIEIFEDYDVLLDGIKKNTIKCDILVIASSENSHLDILQKIEKKLNQKSMIVFCEKPLTTNLNSAKKIREKFRNTNLKLVVNHSRRWSKIWNQAFDFSKKIGKIIESTFDFSTSPENKSLNQLRDGIHIADIINWFEIKDLIHVNRKKVNYFIYDFFIWGEKGKIEVLNNGTTLNYFISKKSKKYEGYNELTLKKSINIKESMLENVYKEFVNFLDGKLSDLSTNVDDAVKALEIFEKYVYSRNLIK